VKNYLNYFVFTHKVGSRACTKLVEETKSALVPALKSIDDTEYSICII